MTLVRYKKTSRIIGKDFVTFFRRMILVYILYFPLKLTICNIEFEALVLKQQFIGKKIR